jgi:hypothetical protein
MPRRGRLIIAGLTAAAIAAPAGALGERGAMDEMMQSRAMRATMDGASAEPAEEWSR